MYGGKNFIKEAYENELKIANLKLKKIGSNLS